MIRPAWLERELRLLGIFHGISGNSVRVCMLFGINMAPVQIRAGSIRGYVVIGMAIGHCHIVLWHGLWRFVTERHARSGLLLITTGSDLEDRVAHFA